MPYTPHQKGIIRRYYEHRDNLMVQKLGELASQLYVAETDKERDRLWDQVHKALLNIKVPQGQIQDIMTRREPAALAKLLEKLF